jgi:hypothetical protein
MFVDGAIESERGAHGHFYRAFVEYRERAGEAETDRADVGVRSVTETIGATTENFGFGEYLRVNLQADHDLVFGEKFRR